MASVVASHHVTRPALAYIVRNLRPRDRAEIFALRWDDNEDTFLDSLLPVAGELWRIWTLDDEPVAINGVVPIRPGVVVAGAFGTTKWRHVVRSMTRWSLDFVIPVLKNANYHRGEAYVLAANTDSRRWIEMLGGEIESVLKGYGRQHEDFLLYAWDLTRDRRASRVTRHLKPRRGFTASIGVQ
jgi:RimJ/RimL family protein N-acetyltransferase